MIVNSFKRMSYDTISRKIVSTAPFSLSLFFMGHPVKVKVGGHTGRGLGRICETGCVKKINGCVKKIKMGVYIFFLAVYIQNWQ